MKKTLVSSGNFVDNATIEALLDKTNANMLAAQEVAEYPQRAILAVLREFHNTLAGYGMGRAKATTARWELSKKDTKAVIREMSDYAKIRLCRVETKDMDGLTADDFIQNVMLKVVEGSYNWRAAATDDFKKFLFGCLRGEIRNFFVTLGRRKVSFLSANDVF